jgi:glycosyltransferase involved in cell wall biosynthesis
VLWRSYLPYSIDRLSDLIGREDALGIEAIGLQVTATDPSYAFLGGAQRAGVRLETCCPHARFDELDVTDVRTGVWAALDRLDPVAVFAPATPFAEGMAAITWALRHRRHVVLMDDAWEATDARGPMVNRVKTLIHECIDGVLVPHEVYQSYWVRLGVARERVISGVDVLDNRRFARPERQAARTPSFLFVGRDLPRKGLDVLLDAYGRYRERSGTSPWALTVVGPVAVRQADGVRFTGPLTGAALCEEYWSAGALVVPSDFEQWGLVLNEAMSAGLPVLATTTVGSSRVLVTDGVTGWLTPPGDSGAMARRLDEIASLTEATRSRIGRAAVEAVNHHCPLSAFAAGIASALALPPRRPPSLAARLAATGWRGRTRLLG